MGLQLSGRGIACESDALTREFAACAGVRRGPQLKPNTLAGTLPWCLERALPDVSAVDDAKEVAPRDVRSCQ
jgi:hypothetical protein